MLADVSKLAEIQVVGSNPVWGTLPQSPFICTRQAHYAGAK